MPSLSVVVPVYNAARYLGKAIDSILSQSYRDFELVCVDDGSTDGSAALIQSYEDPRVVYVHQENAGPGAARNRGIEAARGKYVAFCDADDVQLPYRLECQVMLLERFPEAACAGGEFSEYVDDRVTAVWGLRKLWIGPLSRSLDEEMAAAFSYQSHCGALGLPVPKSDVGRPVYYGRAASLIALAHVLWGNCSTFRREALDEVGRFDSTVRHYEDWHLVARLAKRFPLVFMDVPVMLYRRHAEQYTKIPGLAPEGYLRVINDVWRSDLNFYATHREVVNRALGAAYYQAAGDAAAAGDWTGANENYRRSIVAYPRQRRVYLEFLRSALNKRLTDRL